MTQAFLSVMCEGTAHGAGLPPPSRLPFLRLLDKDGRGGGGSPGECSTASEGYFYEVASQESSKWPNKIEFL